MADYIDYVKGGDILMAPTLHANHRFVLKCNQCEVYCAELEQFLTHFLSHRNDAFCRHEEVLYPLYGKVEEVELLNKDEYGDNEAALSSKDVQKYEFMDGDIEDEALMNTEEVYLKEETTFQEEDVSNHSLEIAQTDGLSVANSSNLDEHSGKDAEKNKEAAASKDNKLTKCVRDFMKSKTNIMALIEAYKGQPLLWNFNYLPNRRAKERQNCLQKIVNVLKNNKNVNLSCNEISAILVYIRQKYKEKLRSIWLEDGNSNKDKTSSYLKHLDFLKPFIENNSIVVLSEERPHLLPEQITQIFTIYKNFPHLWDSNLVENVCTNKRNEAIKKMLDVINTEMGLKLDQNLLENYVSSIHAYCSKEKRRDINAVESIDSRPEYYEHIRFLFNHVSPFKCPTCLRDFRNPLYFREHLIEHDDTKRLKCSQCDKEYKSAALYMEHAKRHMNDMTKECKVCGKQFLKTRALTHHMRIHTGDKPYVCDICGNSFRHIQTFNAHKRTHNKDYMHYCPVCSKGFYTKSTMNVHVATHGSERNYVCEICSKAFKTKINLTHHEWTHEDGCHPCDLCGKTYKNKYSLYQHTKTHRKKIEII